MKHRIFLFWAVFSVCLVSPVFSAQTAQLNLSGPIEGKSDDGGWIEIISVSGLPASQSQASPSARGRMSIGDLPCTRYVDKASPKLQEICDSGTEIPEMALRQGKVTYVLSKVRITSIKSQGKKEVLNLHCASVTPLTTKAAATDYNSSRSNRTTRAASAAPAQDYNSSRSNKGG